MISINKRFTFAPGDTTCVDQVSNENGFIRAITYTIGNMTTAVSCVFTVIDINGNTIYTSAAIPESATTVVTGLTIPLDYNWTFKAVLNDVNGKVVDEVITVVYYVENV